MNFTTLDTDQDNGREATVLGPMVVAVGGTTTVATSVPRAFTEDSREKEEISCSEEHCLLLRRREGQLLRQLDGSRVHPDPHTIWSDFSPAKWGPGKCCCCPWKVGLPNSQTLLLYN